MNLNDINGLISFILKDIKPDLVLTKPMFERLVHSAQVKQFTELLPAFESTKIISVELAPFKKIMGDTTPELVIDALGYAVPPSDCYYPSSARFRHVKDGTVNWYDIVILDDKQYEDRVASNLYKPSLQYPVCNYQSGVMRFSPVNLKRAYFVYLRMPMYPVYAVTTTRGFQEFDEANSTVWEWTDVSTVAIIQKLMSEINIDLAIESINNYQKQQK
jgi:hypothetical protein